MPDIPRRERRRRRRQSRNWPSDCKPTACTRAGGRDDPALGAVLLQAEPAQSGQRPAWFLVYGSESANESTRRRDASANYDDGLEGRLPPHRCRCWPRLSAGCCCARPAHSWLSCRGSPECRALVRRTRPSRPGRKERPRKLDRRCLAFLQRALARATARPGRIRDGPESWRCRTRIGAGTATGWSLLCCRVLKCSCHDVGWAERQ